jgi:uridine kinase
LIPIRQKAKVEVKIAPVDYLTDERQPEKKFNFDRETIIIFEGVFIFRKELAPFIDYKVFIDISLEELKKRARIRDDPEVFKRYETKYIPAQIRYLAEYSPRKIADILIDNNDWEQPRTESLLQ